MTTACPHRTGIFLAFDERVALLRLQLASHPVQFGAPGAKDSKPCGKRTRFIVGFVRIGLVQPGKVGGDSVVETGLLLGDLPAADHLFRAGGSAEFRAVQRHQPGRKQTGIPAHEHEGPACPDDGRAVVAAEIGNRLEVGGEPSHQPHRLNFASAGPLQPARRANLVEIAPHIELQKVTRIKAGPTRRCRGRTHKAESCQIETIRKGVDHPNRSVGRHVVCNP